MDKLGQISTFIRVVEEGSFSAAARSLRTSQPTVSKALAQLEHTLNVRLLNRTTKQLSPTEAGLAYYERTKHLMGQLEDADRQALAGRNTIAGRLRVNTSALLSGKLVVPALVAFKAAYPAIEVELAVDDRRIDPVEYATDVAVRTGILASSSLRMRRAGQVSTGIFASPEYLKREGLQPDQIRSLAGQQFISFIGQKPGHDLGSEDVVVAFAVSNAPLAREVALAGMGLAMMPRFFAQEDVDAGRLVQVLEHINLPPSEISLLHPFGQDAPRSVTAFVDFAIELWRSTGMVRA